MAETNKLATVKISEHAFHSYSTLKSQTLHQATHNQASLCYVLFPQNWVQMARFELRHLRRIPRKGYVLKRPLFQTRNNHCGCLFCFSFLYLGVHNDIPTARNKMSLDLQLKGSIAIQSSNIMHSQKHVYIYKVQKIAAKIPQMLILPACHLFASIITFNDSCHVRTVLIRSDYILTNQSCFGIQMNIQKNPFRKTLDPFRLQTWIVFCFRVNKCVTFL